MSIGWLHSNNATQANSLFRQLYSSPIKDPFYLWNEPSTSCPNSLPAAGGFLQVLTQGSAGIRIEDERLLIDPVTLPEGIEVLRLKNVRQMFTQYSLLL
jgi:trehalose/maltose hydrolase-like predicted phosphorylase